MKSRFAGLLVVLGSMAMFAAGFEETRLSDAEAPVQAAGEA